MKIIGFIGLATTKLFWGIVWLFTKLFEFFNTNDGAVIAIATVVLVVVTWYYARETKRTRQVAEESLAVAAESLRVTKQSLRLIQRPEVLVSWHVVRGMPQETFVLCIRNVGKEPAYNIDVKPNFSPQTPEEIRIREISVFEHGIDRLGSGQRKDYSCCHIWINFLLALQRIPSFEIIVNYRDSTGRGYTETFAFDFSGPNPLLWIDPDPQVTIAEKTSKIDISINSLESELHRRGLL